jgi:hypothetical protein
MHHNFPQSHSAKHNKQPQGSPEIAKNKKNQMFLGTIRVKVWVLKPDWSEDS